MMILSALIPEVGFSAVLFVLFFSFVGYLLLAFSPLHPRGRKQTAGAALLLVFIFIVRALALGYETPDYQDFLAVWVDYFRNNGGLYALAYPLGNYNVPYLVFLALFSYLPGSDLFWIKSLSVFFDLILAWSCGMLVLHFCPDSRRSRYCFFAVLCLPTVFLNGALWGQCDSIYVSLAVLSLWLALENRSAASVAAMAASFCFKLQAVFFLPIFAVLLYQKKIRWFHLPVFPLVYTGMILPAVFMGRPFPDTLFFYFGQTGSIGEGLNYNSPSVFSLFDGFFLPQCSDADSASTVGILCAFLFLFLVLLAFPVFRAHRSTRSVLIAANLLAVGIPFFLPHMHDRYFFGADILSVCLAFVLPEAFPAAVLIQFASLLGYHAYLKMRYLLMMRYGGFALILCLILLMILYIRSFTANGCEKAAPLRRN